MFSQLNETVKGVLPAQLLSVMPQDYLWLLPVLVVLIIFYRKEIENLVNNVLSGNFDLCK